MKFDLHIHSIESKYKEAVGIVDDSNINNIDIILNKLEENEVGLFSITDHNRFNVDLYEKLDAAIKDGKYNNIKGLVAGVEFDVCIDAEMGKCHIITIFDAKNKIENYNTIKSKIDKNRLESKEQFYNREDFETILRKIGLDVILIACQRSSLEQHNGKHNSLSESTMDSKSLIMTGYINALEFQRPNVEGILRNNLKEVPKNVGLVMGSDCHDWGVYPDHDKKNGNKQFKHSRAKIMPTFKGLLMAVTSPETRINQQESKNINYIDKFMVGDNEVHLVNGINAIIGENGSGKSTLLKLLNNKMSLPPYVKSIVEFNKMNCQNKYPSKKLFIGQGEIVQKFDSSMLFPKENFVPVEHTNFEESYKNYANAIMSFIETNIKREDAVNKLSKKYLQYNELTNISTYFLQVDFEPEYTNVDNCHDKPKKEVSDILNELNKLSENDYFIKYKIKIDETISILKPIFNEIIQNYNDIDIEKNLKNTIVSELSDYNMKIKDAATSQEKDKIYFNSIKGEFIASIIDAIKKNCIENVFPESPKTISGFTENPSCGFNFNSESNYHGKNVLNDFLSKMFNQNYSTIDKLKTICEKESLIDAITGCTSYDKIDTIYENNLRKFLSCMCECKNYIVDVSQKGKTIGSTLGELSLSYFKYVTEYENEKCIFLIDQPEDHISNNNISKKLITYLNSIRNRKQVIIVTHNPLLVVNQDVEKVIFVSKNNGHINITSGCLEYEYENINMLDLIAENMDGGKDSIEKRLKVYG